MDVVVAEEDMMQLMVEPRIMKRKDTSSSGKDVAREYKQLRCIKMRAY